MGFVDDTIEVVSMITVNHLTLDFHQDLGAEQLEGRTC